MVFEGKKRFPSIPETLWEFQIVTNSETEKGSRDSETLEKVFLVSGFFLGFRVCYYLKLLEGFRNARKFVFLPSKTIFGFPNVRDLILAGIREYLFFLECRQSLG